MLTNHHLIPNLTEEEYNEKLNQETLARWKEVENGKVVSHQAVIQWLNTWGSDKETAVPG